MGQANVGGIAAVAGLYLIFLAVGWLATRHLRHGTAADYLVAGRAMPFWMATLTMAATWIDGGYLLGTAEGVFSSLASGWQGGVAFGLSLVIGGALFARKMRQLEYVTLIDPFTDRFGKPWAIVLSIPAVLGEVFWGAELLVALGASFGVILGLDLTPAIVVSAAVVTFYTMLGGMWSVGYTDTVQFALIPIGLFVALPFALSAVGGWDACWAHYVADKHEAARIIPPLTADGYWTSAKIVHWWDLSCMLVLGGIPWNCYFQRVQSCESPAQAQWHSVAAGLVTIVMTLPPLVLGLAAYGFQGWTPPAAEQLRAAPATALPLLLVEATPPAVAIFGLAAIVGAVTSSFSASVLSAGSMIGWNMCRGWLVDDRSSRGMQRAVRVAVVVLGAAAAVLALHVQSVQALWFFTSDLVFVLVFPQLVYTLFDPQTNRTGSMVAFGVSLVLRLGEGEPMLGLPALFPYASLLAPLLDGGTSHWFDPATHATLFPIRTVAAAAGMVFLPAVSRLTARWDPPRALQAPLERHASR